MVIRKVVQVIKNFLYIKVGNRWMKTIFTGGRNIMATEAQTHMATFYAANERE